MSMGRNIITMNESGNIIMTENVTDIWMSEPELVEPVSYTHLRAHETGRNLVCRLLLEKKKKKKKKHK